MGAVTIQWSVLETAALRHPPANPNWQGLARSGSAGRLAHERTPTPHRQRAAAPAAEDPTGPAGTSRRPATRALVTLSVEERSLPPSMPRPSRGKSRRGNFLRC